LEIYLCFTYNPLELMESDFMDENSRPGAVTGPKSVPRFTKSMLARQMIEIEDCYRIHVETVQSVYHVPITIA
jgi:TatD-related deoxyribonuclease